MEKQIGKVVHFFDRISVAIISLTEDLKVGDQIHLVNQNHGIDFSQKVESMQVEHKELPEAAAGTEVGVKLEQPVKEGTVVFKVS